MSNDEWDADLDMQGINKDTLTGQEWLWCLHCERFFQAKDLQRDDCGDKEGCAFFADCGGAGLDVDIYRWNSWAIQNPELREHWPKSTKELHKGLRCPLHPGQEITYE
jgi:hypothetical protein